MSHRSGKPAAPAAEPKFYQASNRVGPELFIWLPVVGGVGTVVLGSAYAFLAVFLRVIEKQGWLIVVTPMFAAVVGPLGQWVCQLGHVRRRSFRMPIVYVVTGMVLYWSWHAYLNFDRGELSTVQVTWHMSPITLVRAIVDLARERGFWAVVGWVLEAATIVGFVAWGMRGLDPEVPFCEQCGHWTSNSFALKYADGTYDPVFDRLKQGHVEDLPRLGRWAPNMLTFTQVRVMECPCHASRYLTIERVKITPGKSGKGLYLRRRRTARVNWTLDYDIGTFDEAEQTPILENMQLDEPLLKQLQAIREQQKAADKATVED